MTTKGYEGTNSTELRKRPPQKEGPGKFDLTPSERAAVEVLIADLEARGVPRRELARHERLWNAGAWSFEDLYLELGVLARRHCGTRIEDLVHERFTSIGEDVRENEQPSGIPSDLETLEGPSGSAHDPFGLR